MAEVSEKLFAGYLNEHGSIIHKVSSNEAWAYSFVALYFGVLALLAAATGFVLSSQSPPVQELNTSRHMAAVSLGFSLALGTLGLVLNAWAIAMVFDYKITTRSLVRRLAFLEEKLGLNDEGALGIGSSNVPVQQSTVWNVGQFVLVGSVMVLFFLPWLVVSAG
jgi:hypothetical protein